jgi:hypothetical protein
MSLNISHNTQNIPLAIPAVKMTIDLAHNLQNIPLAVPAAKTVP